MQDKRWYYRGHFQNDHHGRPLFLHRSSAKLTPGVDNSIAYITSPIGHETFKRYRYVEDPEGKGLARALDEGSGRVDLLCHEMDDKTVSMLQENDSTWYGTSF